MSPAAQSRLAGELVSRVRGQMEQIQTGNGGERGNVSVCKAPRGLWLVLEPHSPISVFSSVTGWLWRVTRELKPGVSVGTGQTRGHQAAHAMWQPPPRPFLFTPGPRAAVPAASPECGEGKWKGFQSADNPQHSLGKEKW